MATKQDLHRRIDSLPDDEVRSETILLVMDEIAGLDTPRLQALAEILRRAGLKVLIASRTEAAPEAPTREATTVGAEVWVDDADTGALTRLSLSALRRDWDSEADSIYDDEPPQG